MLTCSYSFSSFFYYCSGDHRDLHSFPTRRSSDLDAPAEPTPPYRTVVVNDQVLDPEGQKMSKSRGNAVDPWEVIERQDRKSTRLNSSHSQISYAVFCLKKKKKKKNNTQIIRQKN